MNSEISEFGNGKPIVVAAVSSVTAQLSIGMRPWLGDLISWSAEHDPEYSAVQLVASDVEINGVARAIDGWCRADDSTSPSGTLAGMVSGFRVSKEG